MLDNRRDILAINRLSNRIAEVIITVYVVDALTSSSVRCATSKRLPKVFQ